MYNKNEIIRVIRILMKRDNLNKEDAIETVKIALEEVQEAIDSGKDVESVWGNETGLEPDCLYAIMM